MPKSSSLDDLEWPIRTRLHKRKKDAFLESNTKISMKIDPYTISGKMGEWSKMQRNFSHILNSDTKTGDLRAVCGYLILEKLIGHVCWRHIFVALSELIVSIRVGLSVV